MKKLVIIGMLFMMIASSIPVSMADDDYEPQSPNFMGIENAVFDFGDTIEVDVWADIHSPVDTAGIENLTFSPTGIVNYSSTAQGDLFPSQLVWMVPEGGGVIDNDVGYAYPITWGSSSVNDTNATLATITWDAISCGVVTVSITLGGTSLGGSDPGTTFVDGTITVRPASVTGFTASQNGQDIDLSWTKATGADTTVIRYRTDTYPTSPQDGTEVYNGTGTSTTHTGLTQGDTYYYAAWGYESGAFSNNSATANETANAQPSLGTPNPSNGTTDLSTSFIWEIPISDNDGDMVDYSIECSNGDSVSGSTIPGTKQLTISGLSLLTSYTVWVNATDSGGTGLTTSAWYTFTTGDNNPPSYGLPSPSDGAIDQDLSLTWSITITDPEGDNIDAWSIECSNGDTTSGAGTSPVSASLSISGLMYNTTYTVWVNSTDSESGASTEETFTFTTKENQPPDTPIFPVPDDEEERVRPDLGRLRCYVEDSDGHDMDVTFYWGNGTLIDTDTDVPSGTVASVTIPDLEEYTDYYWYVEAEDEYEASTAGPSTGNWTFTTGEYRRSSTTRGSFLASFLIVEGYSRISGATISIYKQGPTAQSEFFVQTDQSDDNGFQEFALAPGDYKAIIKAPGYEEKVVDFSSTQAMASQDSGVDLIVQLVPTTEEGNVMLLIGIIMLIVSFVIAWMTKIQKVDFDIGFIASILLGVVAAVIGIVSTWILIPLGAAMALVELIWLKFME